MSYKYKAVYDQSGFKKAYERKAFIAFVFTLKYNVGDVDLFVDNYITDGTEDKSIDTIYVDKNSNLGIICQVYESKSEREKPKSAKADSLNTAVTWALSVEDSQLPETIKDQVITLREGIKDDTIKKLEFWFVHNCDETVNVDKALSGVRSTAEKILQNQYPDKSIEVICIQYGNKKIEELYNRSVAPILIDKLFIVSVKNGAYKIKTGKWNSISTAIPLKFIYDLYRQYHTDLFSANFRDYLGSQEINNDIKKSAKEIPENFWIYNNGITCLVHSYKYFVRKKELHIKGISIINGAQTTGSIGNLDIEPSIDGYVPARFIICKDITLRDDIVKYNNTQNIMKPSDFRSTDPVQRRLSDEFITKYSITYKARRGGSTDKIKRDKDSIWSDAAIQTLAAFHGDPINAYNDTAMLWSEYNHYQKYFNESTKAEHILFTYSLSKAIDSVKKERSKLDDADPLKEQLALFKKRGARVLLISLISNNLDVIMRKKISDKRRLTFGGKKLKKSIELWIPLVEFFLAYYEIILPALETGLNNMDRINKVNTELSRSLEATYRTNKKIFDTFIENVKISDI